MLVSSVLSYTLPWNRISSWITFIGLPFSFPVKLLKLIGEVIQYRVIYSILSSSVIWLLWRSLHYTGWKVERKWWWCYFYSPFCHSMLFKWTQFFQWKFDFTIYRMEYHRVHSGTAVHKSADNISLSFVVYFPANIHHLMSTKKFLVTCRNWLSYIEITEYSKMN